MAARDLIRDALDMEEDVALAELADGREASFREDAALSHEEVWGPTRQLAMYIARDIRNRIRPAIERRLLEPELYSEPLRSSRPIYR